MLVHKISADLLLFRFVWSIRVSAVNVPRQYIVVIWIEIYSNKAFSTTLNDQSVFKTRHHEKLHVLRLLNWKGTSAFVCNYWKFEETRKWKLRFMNRNDIIPMFFHLIENQDRKPTTSLPLNGFHMTVLFRPVCLHWNARVFFHFSPLVFSQDLIGYWSTNPIVRINVSVVWGIFHYIKSIFCIHLSQTLKDTRLYFWWEEGLGNHQKHPLEMKKKRRKTYCGKRKKPCKRYVEQIQNNSCTNWCWTNIPA